MFIAGNFLIATASVLHMILQTYMIVVFVRVVISWVNPDPRNLIVQILHSVTDPLLVPIRRKIFQLMGYRDMMIDFSPLILLAAIYFLDVFLVGTLYDLGGRVR